MKLLFIAWVLYGMTVLLIFDILWSLCYSNIYGMFYATPSFTLLGGYLHAALQTRVTAALCLSSFLRLSLLVDLRKRDGIGGRKQHGTATRH